MDNSDTLLFTFELSVDDDLTKSDVKALPYSFAHDQIVEWRIQDVKHHTTYTVQKFSLWHVDVFFKLDTEFDSEALEYFISFYQAACVHASVHYLQLLKTELTNP